MQTQVKQSSRTKKLLREFKELPFDEQREFYININYLFNNNLGHLPKDYKFDREELHKRDKDIFDDMEQIIAPIRKKMPKDYKFNREELYER